LSPHAQLVLVLGVTSLVGIAAAAFVCWLVWSLFWSIYDHVMQQRTRRKNAQFDARVGRDCYRDVQGVHR
jgi:hypothetical protein